MKRLAGWISIVRKSQKIVENWIDVFLISKNLKNGKFSTLKTRGGLKIKFRNNSTDIRVFRMIWIDEEYSKKEFLPAENETVIDIGAHVGFYTLYVSQITGNAKVFSFEPASENYILLKENIKNNLLDNVKIFNLAVSGRVENRQIFLSKDQSAHSICQKTKKSEIVSCTTIDKIIRDNDIEKISILKLDCEGAEYDIIRNISDISFRKIEKICMEYHPNGSTNELDDLKRNLTSRGFVIEVTPTRNGLGMIFARRRY